MANGVRRTLAGLCDWLLFVTKTPYLGELASSTKRVGKKVRETLKEREKREGKREGERERERDQRCNMREKEMKKGSRSLGGQTT